MNLEPLLSFILQRRRFKVVLIASSLVFWGLYASSAGMVRYYASDLTQYLRASEVPNPYLYLDFSSLSGALISTIVWYPNGHLQLVFPIITTFFSILLAILFGLNMTLAAHGFRTSRSCMGTCSTGLVSMVASLFVGGCCATPFGILLIGPLVSSPFLLYLAYDYPILINIAVALLQFVSIRYYSGVAKRSWAHTAQGLILAEEPTP